MNILFIEDDEDKAKRVLEFVRGDVPKVHAICARSFNSGLKALADDGTAFDLVLLDMTMPTYDVTPSEPTGGSIEHFAGRDLLAQMKLRQIEIPVAVITMFDSFGEGAKKMSLANLSQELHSKYGRQYLGHVYYNATEEGWRSSLRALISKLGKMKSNEDTAGR
jgi:CheY-like chemotaxis protein